MASSATIAEQACTPGVDDGTIHSIQGGQSVVVSVTAARVVAGLARGDHPFWITRQARELRRNLREPVGRVPLAASGGRRSARRRRRAPNRRRRRRAGSRSTSRRSTTVTSTPAAAASPSPPVHQRYRRRASRRRPSRPRHRRADPRAVPRRASRSTRGTKARPARPRRQQPGQHGKQDRSANAAAPTIAQPGVEEQQRVGCTAIAAGTSPLARPRRNARLWRARALLGSSARARRWASVAWRRHPRRARRYPVGEELRAIGQRARPRRVRSRRRRELRPRAVASLVSCIASWYAARPSPRGAASRRGDCADQHEQDRGDRGDQAATIAKAVRYRTRARGAGEGIDQRGPVRLASVVHRRSRPAASDRVSAESGSEAAEGAKLSVSSLASRPASSTVRPIARATSRSAAPSAPAMSRAGVSPSDRAAPRPCGARCGPRRRPPAGSRSGAASCARAGGRSGSRRTPIRSRAQQAADRTSIGLADRRQREVCVDQRGRILCRRGGRPLGAGRDDVVRAAWCRRP